MRMVRCSSPNGGWLTPRYRPALFAKLDVTFGEGTNGIGAKAGVRVSW
jgi:hypothetical protein